MKKAAAVFGALITVLSLSACETENKSGSPSLDSADESKTSTSPADFTDAYENTFPQIEINFPSCEEVQSEYPDKTVIVWLIQETGWDRNYPFRTREVNEYLDLQGCDFAVCFRPIRANQSEDQTDFYTAYVEEMVSGGDQVDIINTSFTYLEEGSNNAYHKFVQRGLFEPLDKYFESESGQSLYALMPENHWEGLRVNGEIYGVDGRMTTISQDYGYYINAELAEKYEYDTSAAIEDQLDILKEIKEKEENCDVFAFGSNKLERPTLYLTDKKEITYAVCWNYETHSAQCVFDVPEVIGRLRLFDMMKKNSLLTDINFSHGNNFFILQGNKSGGNTLYNSSETVEIEYFDNTVKAVPVFTAPASIVNCNMATGICSSSDNKDKAFELLVLTQTDPYLNNLLTYGLEGTDYNVIKNTADTVINSINLDRFPNYMICYSNNLTAAVPNEYESIYKNAVVHDDLDFTFNGKTLTKEILDTSAIMTGFSLPADDKSLDDALAELKDRLENAGLQKIIDECNRQY